MNIEWKETFETYYSGKLRAFLDEIGEVAAAGIPEVHLPLCGKSYGAIKPRIAFIGRDTRGWGEMNQFIASAKQNNREALFRSEDYFYGLPFVSENPPWTNNFGTSFWDTVMQFVAAFHKVEDWREIKYRQHDHLLQSFVWGQTNSVETWGATPSKQGADFQTWDRIKAASERHFDQLSTVLKIFQPEVVIVMNWSVSGSYWDIPLTWQRLTDHVDYAFSGMHMTHVFKTAHPTWMRGHRRKYIFEAIMQAWRSQATAAPNGEQKERPTRDDHGRAVVNRF